MFSCQVSVYREITAHGGCRRSSHLASGVVQQFKQAVATNHHRLSDTSGPHPDDHNGLDPHQPDTPLSPAHSTESAPQLEQDGSVSRQSGDHVVLNMDGDHSSRYELQPDASPSSPVVMYN